MVKKLRQSQITLNHLQAPLRIQYYELDPMNFTTPRSHLDAQTVLTDYVLKYYVIGTGCRPVARRDPRQK